MRRSGLGWSLLHLAAYNYASTGTILQLIKEVGISVDVEDNFGTTPLMFAVRDGPHENVKVLLQCGADPSLKDDRGHTAMDHAKQENQLAIVAIIQDQ